jgi:hypothetical protein
MAPAAPMQREAIGMAVMTVLAMAGIRIGLVHRLLAAGDERRQTLDLSRVGAALHSGLLGRLGRKRLGVARNVGLRLARAVGCFSDGGHAGLGGFVAVIKTLVAAPLRLILGAGEMRIVLPELLLCRCNHAIIVLGVLIIIFGRNGIAGCLCVARELNVFFRDMRRVSAYFYVRPVRLEYACHWIVALAVIVIAPAHPLVLTVSHDLPVADPFSLVASCCTSSCLLEIRCFPVPTTPP